MAGDIQSGMPWIGANNPVFGDTWVQLNGPGSEKVQYDELSPSEQVYIVQFLLNAQTPVLIPPSSFSAADQASISGIQAAFAVDQSKHAIITSMLDNWLITIQKSYDEAKVSDQKKRIETDEIQRRLVNLSEINSQYKASEVEASAKDPGFSAVTLGIIITGAAITQVMMPDPSGVVSIKPVQDMAMQTIQQIAPDLTMVIPVFCMGILYTTAAQVVSQPSTNGEKKDFAFAKKYAENMLGLIGSASFNNFLTALVTVNIAKGTPVNEQRMDQLIATLKFILLSSSLALVYIAEAGKMTSIEFRAMLNGDVTLPEGDIRNELLEEMRGHLAMMDPAEAENILASLDSFFDDNQTLETLSSPSKVFQNLNAYLPRGDVIA